MIRSPNIWDAPEVYELENLAADRAGAVDAAIDRVHPLAGADVLDVGCGSGFHLPRLAARGARVVGVEPHLPLVALAHRRRDAGRSPLGPAWPIPPMSPAVPTSTVPPTFPGSRSADPVVSEAPHGSVVAGDAEALPLGDDSVDVVHARWAYFFGAGCERGLAEASRVLRPGGTVLLVDNDASRSTFGRWFRRAYPAYDAVAVQRFWDRQGFTTERLTIEWTFDQRRDLEAVVRIELPPAAADEVLAEHDGLTIDHAVALRWWRP